MKDDFETEAVCTYAVTTCNRSEEPLHERLLRVLEAEVERA